MRVVLKGFKYLFFAWLGLHLWWIVSPMFLPDTPVPPGTFSSVRDSLEGLAEAQRAGPEAEAAFRRELDRSRRFDNGLIIYYVIPVFLVRMMSRAAEARQLSPLSVVAALALLISPSLVWLLLTLIVSYADAIWGAAAEGRNWSPGLSLGQVVGLGVVAVFVLAVSAPKMLSGLLRQLFTFGVATPRRIERALMRLLDEQDGWLARHNGPDIARIGHVMIAAILIGLACWGVWEICDALDGGGIPDRIGFVARLAAMGFSAVLMYRAHRRVARHWTRPQTGPAPVVQDVRSSR